MGHLKSDERGKLRGIKLAEKLESVRCVSFKHLSPNSETSDEEVPHEESRQNVYAWLLAERRVFC
jgi:hypothetical protein